MSRYVYVMACHATASVKIGVSRNPVLRLKSLQMGNPQIVLACSAGPFENSIANTIEKSLHAKLASFALGREWFSVAVADGVAAVMAETDGVWLIAPRDARRAGPDADVAPSGYPYGLKQTWPLCGQKTGV